MCGPCWGQSGSEAGRETVAELCCNLDDMTAEALGFAQERLLEAGALDVFTQPIGMKKGRPGVLFDRPLPGGGPGRTGLPAVSPHHHPGRAGAPVRPLHPGPLSRAGRDPLGPCGVKVSTGWGVTRRKPEYEDLARIAREQGLPLEQVRSQLS